jgi:hypothetical protein
VATESIEGNIRLVTSPLILIDNSTVTQLASNHHSLIKVDTAAGVANVILNGTVLSMVNGSDVTSNLHVVEVAGTLRSISPDPLISVDGAGTT